MRKSKPDRLKPVLLACECPSLLQNSIRGATDRPAGQNIDRRIPCTRRRIWNKLIAAAGTTRGEAARTRFFGKEKKFGKHSENGSPDTIRKRFSRALRIVRCLQNHRGSAKTPANAQPTRIHRARAPGCL